MAEEDLEDQFWGALKTMGLDQEDLADITREKLKSTWKAWVLVNHQDKTGDAKRHQDFQAAYEFLLDMMEDDEDSFEYIDKGTDPPPEDLSPDRLYTHADVCKLVLVLLQHKHWVMHARRYAEDLGKQVARWNGTGWVYTYPSWVSGCTIFEQRLTSSDHLNLIRDLLSTSPLYILHMRIPRTMGVSRKLWVLWKNRNLFHSVAMYPVE